MSKRLERREELNQRNSALGQHRYRDNAEALKTYAKLYHKGLTEDEKAAQG